MDVETGKTLGVDEAGEIWVRGPQASHGYLNLPAQTKDMFMNDGWIRTGTGVRGLGNSERLSLSKH